MPDPLPNPEPVEIERKSRSLLNRAASKETGIRLGEQEIVVRDEVFEALFGQLYKLKSHLERL